MKQRKLTGLVFVFFVLGVGCGVGQNNESKKQISVSPEDAILKLEQMNVPFSKKSFFEWIKQGGIKGEVVIKLFLQAGMDPNLPDRDKYSTTPLVYASQEGHLNIVKLLLKGGADVESKDKKNRTALMSAANSGEIGIVKYLIEKGADVNAVSKSSGTALIKASVRGYPKIVEILIEKDADIFRKSILNKTAKQYAAEKTQFLSKTDPEFDDYQKIYNMLDKAEKKQREKQKNKEVRDRSAETN